MTLQNKNSQLRNTFKIMNSFSFFSLGRGIIEYRILRASPTVLHNWFGKWGSSPSLKKIWQRWKEAISNGLALITWQKRKLWTHTIFLPSFSSPRASGECSRQIYFRQDAEVTAFVHGRSEFGGGSLCRQKTIWRASMEYLALMKDR